LEPLDGVLLRLDRAQEHIDAIDAELRRFLDRDPYEFLPPEPHPDLRQIWCWVKVKEQVPANCSAMASDAIHNMRALLDNLMYALAVKHTGQDPPPFDGSIAFPIHTKSTMWNPNSRKVGSIDPRARAIVESFQPYHRGQGSHEHPLWVLHELSNLDKHRFPQIVGMVVSTSTFNFDKHVSGARVWLTDQPLRNGTHVVGKIDLSRARTRATGPDEVEVSPSFGVGVCFDEPSPNTEDSAQIILEDDLLAFVREVVTELRPFLA
jgi:hypothetical protein